LLSRTRYSLQNYFILLLYSLLYFLFSLISFPSRTFYTFSILSLYSIYLFIYQL
jgi:hypothetical protein